MTHPDPVAWLRAFFDAPNRLTWQQYEAGTLPDDWRSELAPWIATAQRDPQAAILLPSLDDAGAVTWYAAGRTRRLVHALAEDLGGFLGQTYGGFTGRPHDPLPAEAGAVILADALGGPIYRAGPYSGPDIERVRRTLGRYRQVINRRPNAGRMASRSVGALRSRFDRALLAGNETEATRLHDEILASGRLSWDNRLYLRIRLLAGLSQWPEIANDETLLRQARELPLPAQVRSEVIEALYRTFVEPFENPDDPSLALSAFDTPQISRNARLFSTRQDLRQPRAIKAFLLQALLKQAPITELEELVSLLPSTGTDALFAEALRKLVAVRISPAPLSHSASDADTAFDNMEFDRALDLYASLPPSRHIVGRMLHCAKQIGTARAAKIASDAVDMWSEGPQALTTNLKAALADLRSQFLAAVSVAAPVSPVVSTDPDDWPAWTKWVADGAPPVEANRKLQDRAAAWPTNALADPLQAQAFADELGRAAYEQPGIVQLAFPQLFEAFVASTDTPLPAWKPIYSTLLTALTLSSSRSPDELELARVLTSNLVSVGLGAHEYENLVRDLKEILTVEASLTTLDWALDVAEVLVLNRAALPDARLSLIVDVLEIARARAHRLSGAHLEALRMLCDDIAIEPPSYVTARSTETRADEVVPASNLSNRSIAIYTLAEAAGQRAAKLLLQLAPTAKVSLNSDLVCTDRLAGLARNSDLFVFAWRSSKHAAYYCVKEHRPSEKPILMPLGKGSASILNIVLGLA